MTQVIWLVEDDQLQAGQGALRLQEAFQDCTITAIRSESEFRSAALEAASGHSVPDLVVLDMMLPWNAGAERLAPPADVLTGGYMRAGVRCVDLLGDHSQTRHI